VNGPTTEQLTKLRRLAKAFYQFRDELEDEFFVQHLGENGDWTEVEKWLAENDRQCKFRFGPNNSCEEHIFGALVYETNRRRWASLLNPG